MQEGATAAMASSRRSAPADRRTGGTTYTVYYPESVALGYSEERTGIDIVVPLNGIEAPDMTSLEPELSVGRDFVTVFCRGPTDATVSLVDPLGRSAAVLHRGVIDRGRHVFRLPASLPSGPYFVLVRWPGGMGRAKLVKAK